MIKSKFGLWNNKGLAGLLVLTLLITSMSCVIPQGNTVLVTRVIDGDTIEIEGGAKIRYIGIDAPEIAYAQQAGEFFGQEASEKNRELVEGKRVYLEKDTQNEDDHGRLLRYVWVNDMMVNAELVKLGYAYSYTCPPNVKYQKYFLQLEEEAREQEQGLWATR